MWARISITTNHETVLIDCTRIVHLTAIPQIFQYLEFTRLQFGFKKGCSTDLCTGLLKIISSYYIQRASKVRCALLDMSTFDMVDHGHLFDLLMLRKLPYPVLRFLIQWYSQQCLQIRWKGTLSSTFSVANGVRQGGILSLILFTVYIDKLLQWLANIGVGCHWKGMFASCLCYEDDLPQTPLHRDCSKQVGIFHILVILP